MPVLFLQPDTMRSRRAIGFDMYSNPARREAMNAAERLVRPTASGRITLVQEGGDDAPGFLIYMPVFESVGPTRSVKGYIYSPFNANDFVQSAADLVDLGEYGVRAL